MTKIPKEKTLSDERTFGYFKNKDKFCYLEENLKQAIKKLKEEEPDYTTSRRRDFHNKINKIFGDKLT